MAEQKIDGDQDIPTGENLILSASFAKDGEEPPAFPPESFPREAQAMLARLARHTRTHELAIVAVIALAAVAGLGRASRASSFARVAAWDKRRSANQLRGRKAGRA